MMENIRKLKTPKVIYVNLERGMGEVIIKTGTKDHIKLPVNIANAFGVKGLYIEKFTSENLFNLYTDSSNILIGEYKFGKVYKRTKGSKNYILLYDPELLHIEENIPEWVWA